MSEERVRSASLLAKVDTLQEQVAAMRASGVADSSEPLRARHAEQVQRLHAEHEAALKDLESKHERRAHDAALEAASTHAAALARLEREHATALAAERTEAAALRAQVERQQTGQDKARTEALVQERVAAKEELEHVRKSAARDREWLVAQHAEELAAVRETCERRVRQAEAEREQGKSLEAIMETVSSSASQFAGLSTQLREERAANLEEKEAAYRARAALLQVHLT